MPQQLHPSTPGGLRMDQTKYPLNPAKAESPPPITSSLLRDSKGTGVGPYSIVPPAKAFQFPVR